MLPAFSFMPPYGKRHVIAFGGVTTVFGTALLAVMLWPVLRYEPLVLDITTPPSTQTISGETFETLPAGDLAMFRPGFVSPEQFTLSHMIFDASDEDAYYDRHLQGALRVDQDALRDMPVEVLTTAVIYGGDAPRRQSIASEMRRRGVRTVYVVEESATTLGEQGYRTMENTATPI